MRSLGEGESVWLPVASNMQHTQPACRWFCPKWGESGEVTSGFSRSPYLLLPCDHLQLLERWELQKQKQNPWRLQHGGEEYSACFLYLTWPLGQGVGIAFPVATLPSSWWMQIHFSLTWRSFEAKATFLTALASSVAMGHSCGQKDKKVLDWDSGKPPTDSSGILPSDLPLLTAWNAELLPRNLKAILQPWGHNPYAKNDWAKALMASLSCHITLDCLLLEI